MANFSLEGEKIGIVLATYNPNLDHLRQQLASIQKQTFHNWCCYIVDDSSEEEIRIQIKALCADEPRFSYTPNLHQLGVYRNFEKGLKLASKEATLTAIAFCDQDDIWLPIKLERLLTEMRRKQASLIHSDLEIVDLNGKLLCPSCWQYEGRKPEAVSLELLLLRNTVTGCSLLFCTSLLPYVLPFPEQVQLFWYHDAWVAVIAAHFGKVASLREPLVKYRQHGLNSVGAAKNDGSLLRELKLWMTVSKFRVTGHTYLRRQQLADATFTRINAMQPDAVATLPFSSNQKDFGLRVLSLGIRSCFLGCGATGVVVRATIGNIYLDLRKTLSGFRRRVRCLLSRDFVSRQPREFEQLLEIFKEGASKSPKLFILHNDPYRSVNSVLGGTERHVVDLIKYLSQSSPIYVLYQHIRSDCLFLRSTYLGQQLSLAFPIKKPIDSSYLCDENLAFQEVLSSILKFVQPTVIHIHHLLHLPLRDIRAVVKRSELPFVLSLHDFYHICPSHNLISYEGFFCYPYKNQEYCSVCIEDIFEQGSELKANWWQLNFDFLSEANSIIAPSNTVLDYFYKEYPNLAKRNHVVIPHSVSDSIYSSRKKISEKSDIENVDSSRSSILNIAFVGHIASIKGADNISQVFDWVAKLKDSRKIQFYVFGTFQAAISPLAQDIVHVFGHYEHSELPGLLERFHIDAVAMPSICPETYGLVADEVLSFGIPVITTPITAIAERVSQHHVGWVTRDCSAQALFETITALEPKSEAFREILANVRQYPISSTEQMVSRYVQVYEQICSEAPRDIDNSGSHKFNDDDLRSAYLTARKVERSFREISFSPPRLPVTKRWQVTKKLKQAYPETWEYFRKMAFKYHLLR